MTPCEPAPNTRDNFNTSLNHHYRYRQQGSKLFEIAAIKFDAVRTVAASAAFADTNSEWTADQEIFLGTRMIKTAQFKTNSHKKLFAISFCNACLSKLVFKYQFIKIHPDSRKGAMTPKSFANFVCLTENFLFQ